MAKNIVLEPYQPSNLKSKAAKMLEFLLNGKEISRKNCHIHGVSDQNDSIHSIGSYIRNILHVPLISNRQFPDRRVVHYLMASEEIIRYYNPHQRELQKAEMK